MLIQNMQQGKLVNGSLGLVVAFDTTRKAIEQHIELAKVDSKRATTNAVTPAFAQGMPDDVPMEELLSNDRVWPIVKFQNGRTLMCVPAGFSVTNVFGGMEAQRDQVRIY